MSLHCISRLPISFGPWKFVQVRCTACMTSNAAASWLKEGNMGKTEFVKWHLFRGNDLQQQLNEQFRESLRESQVLVIQQDQRCIAIRTAWWKLSSIRGNWRLQTCPLSTWRNWGSNPSHPVGGRWLCGWAVWLKAITDGLHLHQSNRTGAKARSILLSEFSMNESTHFCSYPIEILSKHNNDSFPKVQHSWTTFAPFSDHFKNTSVYSLVWQETRCFVLHQGSQTISHTNQLLTSGL